MNSKPVLNSGCRSVAWLAAVAVLLSGAASADDASLKDGAKKAGHTAGSVVREIGQGAKQAGKAIGGAAKEGGREFRRALKGQSS